MARAVAASALALLAAQGCDALHITTPLIRLHHSAASGSWARSTVMNVYQPEYDENMDYDSLPSCKEDLKQFSPKDLKLVGIDPETLDYMDGSPVVFNPKPEPRDLSYNQETFDEIQSGEAQLFDIREPWECAKTGVFEKAILIPLSDLQQDPPIEPAGAAEDKLKKTYVLDGGPTDRRGTHFAHLILIHMGYYNTHILFDDFKTFKRMGLATKEFIDPDSMRPEDRYVDPLLSMPFPM